MSELLKLLETKNYWFQKFLLTCEKFIVSLKENQDKAIDGLELFEKNRESLLNIIRKTDHKIKMLLDEQEMRECILGSEQKTKINYFMREKDSILSQILKIDNEIISMIEIIKNESFAKLKKLETGKKTISKYKSSKKQSSIDKRV